MATIDEASHADHSAPAPDAPRDGAPGEEGTKRKTSFDGDDGSSKRPRLDSTDDAAPGAPPSRQPQANVSGSVDERRKSAVQEEKKRSKRLFGGLLSTLSQTNANPLQRRRQEIDRRQQERLQQQNAEVEQKKAEDDQKRADKAARLRDIRMRHQLTWDEEVMRNRHANMLDRARYLRTETKPHIYYLPWKLTEDQRDTIDDQIYDARRLIDRELDDFEHRKRHHDEWHVSRRRSSAVAKEPPMKPASPVAATDHEKNDAPKPEEEKKPSEQAAPEEDSTAKSEPQHHVHHSHHHDDHDDSGDVMVEAGEDMVIY